MDERQKQIRDRSLANGGMILAICLIILIFYKAIFTNEDPIIEIIFIFIWALAILISDRLSGDIEQPKGFKGKLLPLGNSKVDRKARKKYYALSSIKFGVTFIMIDLLFKYFDSALLQDNMFNTLLPSAPAPVILVLTVLRTFVIGFVVYYIFDYLVGEYKVKRYNQMIEKLDAEEAE